MFLGRQQRKRRQSNCSAGLIDRVLPLRLLTGSPHQFIINSRYRSTAKVTPSNVPRNLLNFTINN